MKSIPVKRSDPMIDRIIRATFPGYRGRKIKVIVKTEYRLSDYWDGGSRNYATFLDLQSFTVIPSSQLPEQFKQKIANPFNLPIADITLSPGFAVVENCIFRGKDLGIRIYIHPDNLVKMIPESVSKEL